MACFSSAPETGTALGAVPIKPITGQATSSSDKVIIQDFASLIYSTY
jgi:hypothetical protein